MANDMQAGADEADSAGPAVTLRPAGFGDPFRWLARGTRDFVRAPEIGLFFGACFVAMGWGLQKVFENAPAFVLGLSAGFLLVGPLLCVGLYRVSECLERGLRPRFLDAVFAWRRKLDTLAIFGVVLLVLEMLPGFAGLLVVSPILGHASWHAYRTMVEPLAQEPKVTAGAREARP